MLYVFNLSKSNSVYYLQGNNSKENKSKIIPANEKKQKTNQTSNYPLKKQMETIFLIDKKNELSRLM